MLWVILLTVTASQYNIQSLLLLVLFVVVCCCCGVVLLCVVFSSEAIFANLFLFINVKRIDSPRSSHCSDSLYCLHTVCTVYAQSVLFTHCLLFTVQSLLVTRSSAYQTVITVYCLSLFEQSLLSTVYQTVSSYQSWLSTKEESSAERCFPDLEPASTLVTCVCVCVCVCE